MRIGWDKQVNAYLPESFLTMFLSDRTTPYTSFVSSSKGRVFDLACSTGFFTGGSSPTATTRPVVEDSVFRGLVNADGVGVALSCARGETAWETAFKMFPSPARFGCLVRCQS